MQLFCWNPTPHLRLAATGLVLWSLVCVTSSIAQNQPGPSGDKAPSPAGANEKAAGQGARQSTLNPRPAGAAPALDSTLHLGVGDLIEVSVYNVPELTTKVRVGDSGDIYLPLIDYVHVAGLTADEAQVAIQKRLETGGFVKSPHVSVFVDQYASQGVSVLGEIARPAVYPIMGQQRLFDLISTAGGLTEKSGRSATITHRNQPDKPVVVAVSKNLADNPESNVEIFPGDTVIVKPADIVYVVGDVARPTGLLIDRGTLTVLQALALAGGTTRTSKPNGAKIIHKGNAGMTETHVELKKIMQAKSPDVTMNADDILFIPSSSFKTALQDNASLALQVTSLSLVAVR
jgi:polysaccharide biosynthesis/export protein